LKIKFIGGKLNENVMNVKGTNKVIAFKTNDGDEYINHKKKDRKGYNLFILKPDKNDKKCYTCRYVGVNSKIHKRCINHNKWKSFK
jgi:hypothetical protein